MKELNIYSQQILSFSSNYIKKNLSVFSTYFRIIEKLVLPLIIIDFNSEKAPLFIIFIQVIPIQRWSTTIAKHEKNSRSDLAAGNKKLIHINPHNKFSS